jgi:hypothetical protein
MIDLIDLVSSLLRRGAALNEGFSKNEFPIKMASFYEDMYRLFDGFADGRYDEDSSIRILPIAEVMASKIDGESHNSRYIIADFLMGSDQYSADLLNQDEPVLSSESGEEIAGNAPDFLECLAAGRYDFL